MKRWFAKIIDEIVDASKAGKERAEIDRFIRTELTPRIQNQPTRCIATYELVARWAKGDAVRTMAAAEAIWDFEHKTMLESREAELVDIVECVERERRTD